MVTCVTSLAGARNLALVPIGYDCGFPVSCRHISVCGAVLLAPTLYNVRMRDTYQDPDASAYYMGNGILLVCPLETIAYAYAVPV